MTVETIMEKKDIGKDKRKYKILLLDVDFCFDVIWGPNSLYRRTDVQRELGRVSSTPGVTCFVFSTQSKQTNKRPPGSLPFVTAPSR